MPLPSSQRSWGHFGSSLGIQSLNWYWYKYKQHWKTHNSMRHWTTKHNTHSPLCWFF